MKENKDFTHPSCQACHAHDGLEEKVTQAIKDGDKAIERSDNNMKKNSEEHTDILTSIDVIITNINWMNVIGKWVLAVMLMYFVSIGIYIFSNDFAKKRDVDMLNDLIQEGEVLHYRNESVISSMETKLDMILTHTQKERNE